SARRQLELDVMNFLREMKDGGERQLGRNPNSGDLLPYFGTYAQTVFDAEVQELLPLAASTREKYNLLREAVRRTIEAICGKEGVWYRTVRISGIAVDLGTWITPFGAYSMDALRHA